MQDWLAGWLNCMAVFLKKHSLDRAVFSLNIFTSEELLALEGLLATLETFNIRRNYLKVH